MIYVTGDCHGNFRRFQSECFPEQANMTKDDTVIIMIWYKIIKPQIAITS